LLLIPQRSAVRIAPPTAARRPAPGAWRPASGWPPLGAALSGIAADREGDGGERSPPARGRGGRRGEKGGAAVGAGRAVVAAASCRPSAFAPSPPLAWPSIYISMCHAGIQGEREGQRLAASTAREGGGGGRRGKQGTTPDETSRRCHCTAGCFC